MKRKLKLIILSVLMSSAIIAQDKSGIAGSFVDIGFGAKPVSLGGAFVGLADDVNAVVWNPAGLYNQRQTQAAFTYTSQLGLIDYHYLAASMPFDDERVVGIGLITSGDEALREWTFQGSYSQKLFFLAVGASVKLRYASFGNNGLSASDFVLFDETEITAGLANQVKGSAFGFGLDIGLLYEATESLKFGLSVRDLVGVLSWDSETSHTENLAKGKYTENVPTELIIGSSFYLTPDVLFVADYNPSLYEDVSDKLRFGAQTAIYDIVYLRGGYQYFLNEVEDEKLVLGLGVNLKSVTDMNIMIDYGYMIEDIANSQRFSLSVSL